AHRYLHSCPTRRSSDLHRPVAAVAAVVVAAGVPVRLLRIDVEEGVAHLVGKAHRVEDEELRLRPEEALLGDAAGLEVGLGAAGEIGKHTSELQSRENLV